MRPITIYASPSDAIPESALPPVAAVRYRYALGLVAPPKPLDNDPNPGSPWMTYIPTYGSTIPPEPLEDADPSNPPVVLPPAAVYGINSYVWMTQALVYPDETCVTPINTWSDPICASAPVLGDYQEAMQTFLAAVAAADAAATHVFHAQPTTPYVTGDTWHDTNGTVYICTTARASGAYHTSDWSNFSYYAQYIAAGVLITAPQIVGGIMTTGTLTGGTVIGASVQTATTPRDYGGLNGILPPDPPMAALVSSGSATWGTGGTFPIVLRLYSADPMETSQGYLAVGVNGYPTGTFAGQYSTGDGAGRQPMVELSTPALGEGTSSGGGTARNNLLRATRIKMWGTGRDGSTAGSVRFWVAGQGNQNPVTMSLQRIGGTNNCSLALGNADGVSVTLTALSQGLGVGLGTQPTLDIDAALNANHLHSDGNFRIEGDSFIAGSGQVSGGWQVGGLTYLLGETITTNLKVTAANGAQYSVRPYLVSGQWRWEIYVDSTWYRMY